MARRKSALEDLIDSKGKREVFAEYLGGRIQSISSQLAADFWPRREEYEQQMRDDFTWRSGEASRDSRSAGSLDELINSVFDLQNDSLNIVGGFACFMTARASDDIFGTDPYFSLTPEGIEDDMLATAMQRHSEWKLRMSPLKAAGLDAIDLAFGLGEGVLKVVWDRDVDVFERVAMVLLHPETGAPMTTGDGEHVTDADEILVVENVTENVAENVTPFPGEEPEAPMPALLPTDPPPEPLGMGALVPVAPTPIFVLTVAKDPSIQIPVPPGYVPQFKEMAIEETNVAYNGVKAHVMHYRDVLVPLTVACIEDSDFVGHRFQMRLSEAVIEFDLSDEQVAKFNSESEEAKAESAKADTKRGETEEGAVRTDAPDPLIEFVECWVKYDPVGDRRIRRIKAVIAVAQKELISADYQANETPKGQLPFFVIRGYKVKNRWYGRGYYEQYAAAQEFIDRNLNRIELRNRYHSNPAKFLNPDALLEGDETDDFELRPDATYRLKAGMKPEDVLSFVEFPDLDERTWQLMQFMIQIIQVRSGVTSAAQGEVSSMPSTATATGIESILQSATTLARLPLNSLKADIERALLYAVKLVYANMDRDEVYTYFEGNKARAATLASTSVKNLDMNVRLLLTRFHQREMVETAEKAVAAMAGYVQLPELEKASQRPLFVQLIKGLGFDQADTIVREPLPVVPMPIEGEQPPGETAPPAEESPSNVLAIA